MRYKPTKFMAEGSHYDKATADYVVEFINQLSHTKGKWAGKKFELLPWQEQIIRDVFGILKEDGTRQFRTAYIEIPKKNGKQLALDTPIPTPDGYTTMGDIKVGDTVFDEKGKPCHVTNKSFVDYDEQAYRITFRDGEQITAGENHQWLGEYAYGRKKIMTTGELFKFGKRSCHFKIRTAKAVEQYFKKSIKHRKKFLKKVGCTGSKRTAEDISLLMWSLGIKNRITKHKETYKVKRYHGLRSKYRYIKSIEPVKNKGMQCIQVDSPSHQYLAGRSFVPTHNSELAAAVALYLLFGDGEPSAEVYGAAADRQQASIVFDVANQMVKMCPALARRSKILTANKRIVNYDNNGFYQVLSADVGTKHGLNVSGLVFDEVHVQPNRKLYDVLTQGSGDAREQPLYFLITTAGNDVNSICYELHEKALDIMEGRKIDPTFYPVIYGAGMDEDWTDPEVWKKANPSLGHTIKMESIAAACESAKQNPAEENAFRQLRLDQWVKQSIRWMPMQKWDACAFPVDERSLEGRVCYGGLDLSQTTDITAFVLVFPPRSESEKYIILPYFWIPEENVPLRVNRDHVPYDVWAREGYLNLTDGNVIHYAEVERFIEELGNKYHIKEIAFDRWGAAQMVQNLQDKDFTVVQFGQGYKDMSPPTKELMNLTLEQRIAHGGHPVLRWMMDNVYVKEDSAGNIKMDKEKSTEKIDGAVAMVMALDRAIRCGADEGDSIYNHRGMIFI